MGTRLIKGLARQLNGSVEWIRTQPGTVIKLTFKAYLGEFEV
jgi:two-component sensor histidine kinase